MEELRERGGKDETVEVEDAAAPDAYKRADGDGADRDAMSLASLPERGRDAAGADGKSGAGHLDPRMLAAWHEWLAALATDAEAAIAASHVYGELAPDARDAWLDALAEDAPRLAVPAVAIYAPLLAVEADDARRERIEKAIGESFLSSTGTPVKALRGIAKDGARVAALVAPLYLSFVRVLWCRYVPEEGFAWARHDPMLRADHAPKDGAHSDGVHLEATPLKLVIEELAHAVLAQRRKGAPLPSCLHLFADLFNAEIEADPQP